MFENNAPKRSVRTATLVAAALAAAVPLSAVTTADASTLRGGCRVTPVRVAFAGFDSTGHRQVNYRIIVRCTSTRTVQIRQEQMEDDSNEGQPDDLTGRASFTRLVRAGQTVTINRIVRMPDTPGDGNEELYQRVKFRVTTPAPDPVTSEWTAWERTTYVSMPNS